MKIAKKRNEVPHGISMETNGYEDKIKSIEISHARTCTPHEPITESELSILRTGLGKFTWISRMNRPGFIYDVAAAAEAFSKGEMLATKKRNLGRRNGYKRKKGGNMILVIWPDL